RGVGGTPCGGGGLEHAPVGGFVVHGQGIHRLHLPLHRPHVDGGVALGQLHRVVTLRRGQEQVLGGDVFGVVDEAVGARAVQGGVGCGLQRRHRPGSEIRLARFGGGGGGPLPGRPGGGG